MLDALLDVEKRDLCEGSIDCRNYVEVSPVRKVVELVLAKVQLGLGEHGFDGVPLRSIAFVEDELDVETIS